jgi:hypothetical protein
VGLAWKSKLIHKRPLMFTVNSLTTKTSKRCRISMEGKLITLLVVYPDGDPSQALKTDTGKN